MNLTSTLEGQPASPQAGRPPLLWRFKMLLLDWFRRTVMAVAVAGSLLILPMTAPNVQAADYTAGNATELASAINSANTNPGADTITLTDNITLSGELPHLDSDIDIAGGDYTIDGADTYRVFFVKSGTVNFSNMTIANGRAQGGNGGIGAGGGAGLGGGLFVYSGTVTTQDVTFSGNEALGGNGGTNGLDGGGGGMGGNGGDHYGGGGGLAYGSNGVSNSGNGGGTNGGILGGNGGFGGGGGGGLLSTNATAATNSSGGSDGGDGGFGGGGGGAQEYGGYGGFGGGGGSGYYGGDGGFGGGGGGYSGGNSSASSNNAIATDSLEHINSGGFGAGDGGYYSGGGGLGAGGGLFAKAGTVTLFDTHFEMNRAIGGISTENPSASGQITAAGEISGGGEGHGGGIFICTATEDDSCSAVVNACNVTYETGKGSNSAEDSGNNVYGTTGSDCPVPEISVIGNSQAIVDGSSWPNQSNHTDFGALNSGTELTRTYSVNNTGTGDLLLSGSPLVTVTNPSGYFSLAQAPAATIAASNSTDLKILYSPAASGIHTATLAIENNDSDESPYTFALQGIACPAQSTLYVDQDAMGASTGLSWVDAHTKLQDALTIADACSDIVEEIWVAEGIYYPDEGFDVSDNDELASFRIRNSLKLYGGFQGDETQREQRDWESNMTILSGDIDQNDTIGENDVVIDVADITGDNSSNVVVAYDADKTATLDGFVITAGDARDVCGADGGGGAWAVNTGMTFANLVFVGNRALYGGGMAADAEVGAVKSAALLGDGPPQGTCATQHQLVHTSSIAAEEDDPTVVITNVHFIRNYAENEGGGLYTGFANTSQTNVTYDENSAHGYDGGGWLADGGTHELTNVTFRKNYAEEYGGGIDSSDAAITMNDVVFEENVVADGDGGGWYISSGESRLTDVTFRKNETSDAGGGLYAGGAYLELEWVNFEENNATNGGGYYASYENESLLKNVTFAGNSATQNGGGMYYLGAAVPTGLNADAELQAANLNAAGFSSASLGNVLFSGNYAGGDGGGLYNETGYLQQVSAAGVSGMWMTNVTFSGNSADGVGGAIKNVGVFPYLNNAIIWNNQDSTGTGNASSSINNFSAGNTVQAAGTGNIYHSLIQGSGGSASWNTSLGGDGGNNIDVDPSFVMDVAPTIAPTTTGNLRLTMDSPAIDNGTLTKFAFDLTTDLDRNPRVAGVIDMGVYEAQFTDVAVSIDAITPTSAEPGDSVLLTLSFSNTGTISATNVIITSTLPSGLSGVSYDSSLDDGLTLLPDPNSTYGWMLTEMPYGTAGTITITAEVDEQTPAANLNMSAEITATNDARPDNNSDSIALGILNVAPTANAGFDIDVAISSLGALNGTQSSDPNGDAITYGWTQTGGPAVVLNDPSVAEPTFTAPDESTVLTFSLIVTDTLNAASTADEVVVSIRNVPITGLNAVSDSPTRVTDGTTFTATITAGSNAVYTWDFGDGNTGNGQIVEHTYAAAGTYTATVTAANDASSPAGASLDFIQNTMDAEVIVQVTNAAPVANAGADQSVDVGETVTLNGSNTQDPDDHLPIAFSWQQTSGTSVVLSSASSHVPSFTAPGAPATLTFELIATDSQGLASTADSVTVTVNDKAIVGLTAENDSPTEANQVTNLSASILAGSNVVYTWDFGDGNSGSGINPAHTYAEAGEYMAKVTASNGTTSLTANTLVYITHVAIAGLTADNDSPTQAGNTTTLSATIAAGENVTFSWDFGDGTTGGGQTPTHVYANSGIYTATVTASNDTNSRTATTLVTITSDPEPDAITGLAATNDSPTVVGNVTTLNATITAGTEVSYSWDFGDGSTGSGQTAAHTYAATGIYTATVTATNAANSQTATTIVTITDVNVGPVAVNDDTHTLMDMAVSIDVILNDTDPNGDPLTVIEVGEARNGTVVQNGPTALYTPNPGFIGRDSFGYTISDGRGETASARVTIRVVEEVNEVEVTPDQETQIVFETQLPGSGDRDTGQAVRVAIVIPANSVTDTAPTDLFEVDFAWVDSTDQAEPPDGLTRTKLSFSTEAFKNEVLLPEYSFNGEIYLTLTYDSSALEGLDLSTLEIRLWDHLNGVWTTVGVRIVSNGLATGAGGNAINELIIAATQTGEFAIFAQPIVPTALDEIDEPAGVMEVQLYVPLSIGNTASTTSARNEPFVGGQSQKATPSWNEFLYLPILQ